MHSLKAVLYNVFSNIVHETHDVFYEVRCEIFHLLYHVGAQKFSWGRKIAWIQDFKTCLVNIVKPQLYLKNNNKKFQILEQFSFLIRGAQPVLLSLLYK